MAQTKLINMKNLAAFSYRNTNLPCNYDYVWMVYKATNYLNTTTKANQKHSLFFTRSFMETIVYLVI
jgi:hypothetical protein